MDVTERLLNTINDTMVERGVTQQHLAAEMKISQAAVQQVLSGKHSRVIASDIEALEAALACRLSVVDVGNGGLLEHLKEDSRLVPKRLQQVMRLLELDVVFVPER